ncbi:MAG: hypothetical protein ACE5FY_02790 [Nitrospiria bacterium]
MDIENGFYLNNRDRRSQTRLNRFRRFLNDYWLIPVLLCYLQLATQAVFPADQPLDRLAKGNQAFFQGIPIAYQIATNEFPFTLLGHFYEMGQYGLYKTDFLQVPHEDLKTALQSPQSQKDIYNRLLSSRKNHTSEVGGLLTISYQEDGPHLHIHEITSLNAEFLSMLRSKTETPHEFVNLVEDHENREVFKGVGIRDEWIKDIVSIVKNEGISENIREKLTENFIAMYEDLSESRYLLTPFQFKNELGKIPFEERFVGLFHFHNGLNEPPSTIDLQQSMRKRQIVMTFSQKGWTLYDLFKKDVSSIEFMIDKEGTL